MPIPPLVLGATTDVLDPESFQDHLDAFTPALPATRYNLALYRMQIPEDLRAAAETLLDVYPADPFPVRAVLTSSRVRYLTVAQAHACQTYAQWLSRQALSQWTLAIHYTVLQAYRNGNLATLPTDRAGLLPTCDNNEQRPDDDSLLTTFLFAAHMSRQDLLAMSPDFTLRLEDNGDVVARTTWEADVLPFPFSPALDDETAHVMDPVLWEQDSHYPIGRLPGLERRLRRHFRRRVLRQHTVVWTPDFLRFANEYQEPWYSHTYRIMTPDFQEFVRRQAAVYLPQSREGIARISKDPRHPCRPTACEILTIRPGIAIFPMENWALETARNEAGILENVHRESQIHALYDYYFFVQENRLPRWYHHLNVYVHKLAARTPAGTLEAKRQDLYNLAVDSADDEAARIFTEGPDFELTDSRGDIELDTESVCYDPDAGRLWCYPPTPDDTDRAFVIHVIWPTDELDMARP